MHQNIRRFLDRVAQAFVEEDTEVLCRVFAAPLIVHQPEDVVLRATKAEVRNSVVVMSRGLRALGTTSVEVIVHEIAERENTGTVACHLDLLYSDVEGEPVARSRLRYYLEPFAGSYRIVMADYEEAAVSDIFGVLQKVS